VDFIQDVAVTHYGVEYNGNSLGCGGVYTSEDSTIIAVGPERDAEWPCGTLFQVCGPGGCLLGERRDSCPGCGSFHIDLSEKGLYLVCGPGSGVCEAEVLVLVPSCTEDPGESPEPVASQQAALALGAPAEVAIADGSAPVLGGDSSPAQSQICASQR
jgi:hypothetical protein